MTVPEYLLRQDRRGGSFQLFKVLLSRWGGLQVKDLSGCLWKYLKTQVWICNITSPEKTEQGEEEAEMTASRVHVLSQVWGCVCFSSWNSWTENLQTFTSLLLIFLPGAFVINLFFPFFLIVVKSGSFDYISLSPRVFSASSVSRLSMEYDRFSTWINDSRLVKTFPLCEINPGRHRFWESYCDVLQSWDLREVGEN